MIPDFAADDLKSFSSFVLFLILASGRTGKENDNEKENEKDYSAGTMASGWAGLRREALPTRKPPPTLVQMSFEEFQAALAARAAPVGLDGALQGLWHDAKGDWEKAHICAQADKSPAGAWVHAYLHRKEGDRGNAGYWYARAGRPIPAEKVALESEWEVIARELLAG